MTEIKSTEKKIQVLIVEDSRVNQKLLTGILEEDPEFEIIGVVKNGQEAVHAVTENKPDVVSMDINMPEMDGLEATSQIMQRTPVPIVIVSSLFNSSDVSLLLKILEAGALTILPKPFGPGHPQYNQSAKNYRNTLKVMAKVKVKNVTRVGASVPQRDTDVYNKPVFNPPSSVLQQVSKVYKIIAIGASAGGPQIIQLILKNLPASVPVPVVIVQHIDGNFAEGYCDWLGSTSKLPVHTAIHGEQMQPGHVYLPPGDHHLGLISAGVCAVTQAPPEKGLRPAVSILFKDVLRVYGQNSIGIILSGMGSDGAAELKMLHDCGAYTIAQDAQSSVVHGMPGEAIKMGAVTTVLTPDEIVKEIVRLLQYNR
jgi:two-component system, chemotaxis family, protein-glutamate methylesterase/glutaminase